MIGKELQLLGCKDVVKYKELNKNDQKLYIKSCQLFEKKHQDSIMFKFNILLIKTILLGRQ